MKQTETFPQRLKRARELRGLNQTDLADKAKIPASSISHFEAGSRKPSFDSLRRLANALEVTTDFLLGRVEEVTSNSGEADHLYRDLQKLSSSDRDTMKIFLETLQRRSTEEKDKGSK